VFNSPPEWPDPKHGNPNRQVVHNGLAQGVKEVRRPRGTSRRCWARLLGGRGKGTGASQGTDPGWGGDKKRGTGHIIFAPTWAPGGGTHGHQLATQRVRPGVLGVGREYGLVVWGQRVCKKPFLREQGRVLGSSGGPQGGGGARETGPWGFSKSCFNRRSGRASAMSGAAGGRGALFQGRPTQKNHAHGHGNPGGPSGGPGGMEGATGDPPFRNTSGIKKTGRGTRGPGGAWAFRLASNLPKNFPARGDTGPG